MIIKQTLLGAQDTPLRMITSPKLHDTRAAPARPDNTRPENTDLSSERQDEAKIEVNKPLASQKSNIKIVEDERLPREPSRNVARKLTYENPSEMKNESNIRA